MKTSAFYLFIGLILLSVQGVISQTAAPGLHAPSYEEVYDQLMRLEPDPALVASVSNLHIHRDVADINLTEGTIYLCKPVAGRVCAALFVGKGTFEFSPPTEIEQSQLYRFYEKKTLDEKFDFLLLVFADSTLQELQHKASFGKGEIPLKFQERVRYPLKFLGNPDGKYFDEDIMEMLLEGKANELFYSYISYRSSSPMLFKVNPYDEEEVAFLQKADGNAWEHRFEVVCQFHRQEFYKSPSASLQKAARSLHIDNYIVDFTIGDNLKCSAAVELDFQALENGKQWVYFYLYPELVVDSAFWSDGKKAIFFSKKKNPLLWVHCDSPLREQERYKLTLYYHGEILEEVEELGWINIKSSIGWYPHYGVREKSAFDLTFHTPAKYRFVSIGENVSTQTDGDVVITHWVSGKPVRNASFNMGKYESFKVESDKIPPVEILVSASGHSELASALISQGVLSGKNMEKQVGADIANSFQFFQHVFGKSPTGKFYATEIPGSHGEAFPGLIHLSWATFQINNSEGQNEIFRAHEVAHQWWGIGVDFQTYHDQWLSEAFAEYAGLWYMQAVLQNNEKFFDVLNTWKKQILSNRKYLFGSGQESGPIWLGYRTQSSSTQGDYSLIIYEKGAWILHMLRNMMLDLKTMNEDRFTNMMRDFYSTYFDKRASTEDFRRIVEKHVGIDMGWFFKEWVYDTKIPDYKFAYRVQETPEGKFKVHCRVQQENVAADFRMSVPLYIDFGEDRHARVRVTVSGPLSNIDLPLLPLKPKKIVFNDFQSVLCESEEVDWESN